MAPTWEAPTLKKKRKKTLRFIQFLIVFYDVAFLLKEPLLGALLPPFGIILAPSGSKSVNFGAMFDYLFTWNASLGTIFSAHVTIWLLQPPKSH